MCAVLVSFPCGKPALLYFQGRRFGVVVLPSGKTHGLNHDIFIKLTKLMASMGTS